MTEDYNGVPPTQKTATNSATNVFPFCLAYVDILIAKSTTEDSIQKDKT